MSVKQYVEISKQLGNELAINMFANIDKEGLQYIKDSDRDNPHGDWYTFFISEKYETKFLIIKPCDPYYGTFTQGLNIYVFNMKTLKPTQKSYLQKVLSKDIILKITDYISKFIIIGQPNIIDCVKYF